MKKNRILSSIILVTFLISIIAVSPVYASPTGLVGDWDLDEGTGSVAHDSVNNNDGILSGGKFGNALYFDGLDDYVSLGSNVFSDSDLATYTLEAWIKIGSLDGLERRIFDDEGGLRPMLNSGNKLQAFHWDSTAWTGKTVTMATTPTVGIWYHIAQTYDGVDMKFYVNNGLIGSIASAAWEPDGLDRDANIGTIWNDLGRYWKGLIDEVRLSNTAKTSFDLNAAPEVEPGLTVALWHFDDSVGTTLSDSSGNGYDGIIYGATWAGPTWTTGVSGDALHFDGADDFVRIPKSASLEPLTITVDCWVRSTNPGVYSYIVSKDLTTHSGSASYAFYTGSTGGLYFYITTPSSYRLSANAGTGVWDGEWHHIIGTYDGIYPRLYVDEAEVTGPLGTADEIIYDGFGNLLIGKYSETYTHPSLDFCFYGDIDGIKIFDYVWTLEFDSDNSVAVAPINTDADVRVCLKDILDNPVGEVTVDFEASIDLSLDVTDPITGNDGCVEFTASSGKAGVYTITATVSPVDGLDLTDAWTIAIYDPSAGFVTGGGWIYSPAGAYAADPMLEGKATFGFVSKYKKGADTPTGNTEFIFHAADLKFKSTSYQWLVITGGNKAMFKGEGEVNGVGGYGFMLSATDGGKDGADTFRIKIWDSSTKEVIYDNKIDDGADETELGGGSIIVHQK